MRKITCLLLFLLGFCYSDLLCAQTANNDKAEANKAQNTLLSKTTLGKLLKQKSAKNSQKFLSKKQTEKVPVSYFYIYWDEDTNDWTDTLENYYISWEDGKPKQIILYGEEDGSRVQYTITDFVNVEEGEGFLEVPGLDKYMFKKAIGKMFVSGQWVDYFKYVVTMNSEGNITEDLEQNWSGSAWVNKNHSLYTYNQDGNETESVEEEWVNNAWQKTNRYITEYDAKGRQTESRNEEWMDGAWKIMYGNRNIYTYNGNSDVTGFESFYYDSEQDTWDGMRKQDYTLNAAGEISSAIEYYYARDEKEWKQTTMYDSIVWKTFQKDFIYGSPFMIGGQDYNSYLIKNWDGTSWVLSGRTTSEYNTAGLMLQTVNEEFVSNKWDSTSKVTYTYYGNGDEKEYISWNWNGLNRRWMKSYAYENVNIYDSEGDLLTGIRRSWDEESGEYTNESKTMINYTEIISSGIKEGNISAGFNVYPNPSQSGNISILLNQTSHSRISLTVYNTSGKTVLQNNLAAADGVIRLDISALPKGIYFINIVDGKRLYSEKIIIQ